VKCSDETGVSLPGHTEQQPQQPSPAARDFYAELRRLTARAGFTVRNLQKATSTHVTSGSPDNHADFYSKSSWQRWLKGEGRYPPRKAIKKLAERLAQEQIPAGHLLELWDRAFAPDEPRAQPDEEPPSAPAAPEPALAAGPLPPAAVRRTELAASWTVHASDHLAGLVAKECAAELTDKVLTGRDSLVVGWQPVAEPGTDPPASWSVPAGDTTDVGTLACHLRHGRWLAVLGEGGSGKTTLALLLMESLLADRSPADPVPVLLPASSLAPGEMVRNWIARTLGEHYPSLRDTQAYGPDAPSDLVAQRKVLPVIDGLDDLEPAPRAALLGALQRALGRDQPLVVTCRSEEYHQAVAEIGRAPQDMTVIELQPVTAADAAYFLERGAAGPDGPSWHLIAAEIRSRPDGPLAQTLSSPLTTSLIRSAYAGRAEAAAALADYDDAAAIEAQILDALVFTRFHEHVTSESQRPRRPVSGRDADRWLAFLAVQLARERSYELDWRRLRYTFPAFGTPARWAILGGALAWIAAGTLFGVSRGMAAGVGAGVLAGAWRGLDAALVVGAIYLVAPLSYPAGAVVAPWLQWLRRHIRTPLRTALIVPAGYALESGARDGIFAAAHDSVSRAVVVGLTAMALNWLVAAAVIRLATRALLLDQVENPVYFRLRVPGRRAAFARTLSAGLLWGTGLGFAVGYGVKILSSTLAGEHPLWYFGMPAGAVLGAAFALVQWGRIPVRSAPAASPASVLRADRNLVLLLAAAFLVVLPTFYGVAFAPGSRPWVLAQFGCYGLGIGLVIWLAIALSHAWPQYLLTVGWHAAHGRLPWGLASFLAEARDLEILRQRGGTYQFRHARLQDRLASRQTGTGTGTNHRYLRLHRPTGQYTDEVAQRMDELRRSDPVAAER
jgi:hypothetical protein